jgi:hypothetical protein
VNFTQSGSLEEVPTTRNGSFGNDISFFQYGDGVIVSPNTIEGTDAADNKDNITRQM